MQIRFPVWKADGFLFLLFSFIIRTTQENMVWASRCGAARALPVKPERLKEHFKRRIFMERYAWKAAVREGMLEEYRGRHAAIWPELVQVLKEAGICNYSIWNVGNELFGYYECEKGADYAAKIQAESPVVARWNEYMKDILVMKMDPRTGAQPLLEQVFLME